MKLDIVHFVEWSSQREVFKHLKKKGYAKKEELVRMVLREVVEILPALEANILYKTEYFCEPDLWDSWGVAERRCAGACMKYLTQYPGFPLELATAEGEYPQLFRLKAHL